jgi:tRNA threonylcarbamoyladenosine biosynthesis protein TsaB
MRILAIDTALAACAAAVFDSEIDEIIASESLAMQRGHAEALMPLIARVMDRAEIDFSALDRVAVTVGPGSFTGLRVGIAAARGIALAASKVAVGVSTLAAFAAPCIAEDLAELTLAAIDARHEHVFFQLFGEGGVTRVSPSYGLLAEAIGKAEGKVHLAGSAAELLQAQWPADRAPPSRVRNAFAPEIGWVARLGVAAAAEFAPAKPLYLRAPDARPQDSAHLLRR